MERILFVLALTVITTQCTIIKNEELAHNRVARSSCVDCDDWPPPPPGPPRPRYLLPYPRYLDYPAPPPPPPPPRPFYYPHLPRPPAPPPPPFGRQHWHRVKNYSDENDDDDGDYSDSASAVSGVTGQNTGKAISIASIGINGDGSSKYTASTGSQFASKGGQSSESFKSQTSGGGSSGQQNSNAQTATNIQTTKTGKLSGAGFSATSSGQSTDFNALSNQESAHSDASSNSQSSQTGSTSSVASNVQSSFDHNSQTTSGSQAQASDQPSFSSSTIPESSSAVGGSGSKSLNALSSKLNQQSSNNFGRYSSEGLDIQSSDLDGHFSVGANRQPISGPSSSAVSNSQLSSDTASSVGSINNVGQFVGSNTKSSSFAGSFSADSNAQSVTGHGSKDLGIINTGLNQDDQTSRSLNIQSSKDLGGSSAESQSSSFGKQISQGSDSVSSNNGGFVGQFPSGYDITSDNSNAESSSSHHTSGKLNKQSSNNSGGSSFASVNTHSGDNRFENQSPVDVKPLYSNNFDDSPSVSSSSESAVVSRPSLNIDNQFSKNIGSPPHESSTSDTPKLQPAGFHPHPLSGFNNQHFESSSKFSNEASNSQSQSSISSHKFSTSSNRQYSSGIPFNNSNTPFGLGGQSSGVSGQFTENLGDSSSEATSAQFGGLNHHNHGSFLDQSSENISGSSSKGLGQFSSESVSQPSKNFDNLQPANPETHPNDHSDKTSTNLYSQSINSFDSSRNQRGDILATDSQNHIPLSGPTGEKNSENSGQGGQKLKSQVYEYHKGGNAGSIENLQQSSSSENFEPDWDHSGPATDLSGLTASGLRNSLAKLKHFGSKNTGSIFNSSLEKPKSDSSYFVSQPSAYYNSQSINNFHGSGQFSDVKEQSPHNFGSISSYEAQSSSSIGPSYAPNIKPININSGLSTDNQPNFGIQSSISHKNTKGFDVNSSSVNTQSSNSFVSSSSHDSNIHSFSMGDEMCVCGPRNSALFTAMSKSGALNGFDGQFTGSTGPNIGDIQTSGGSLENKADPQSANDQTEYKETHYSLLNADGNVAGFGVQFQNPNLDNGNRKEPIDPAEMTASLDVSNNNGLKSTATHEPPPQLISSTPSRLLLPPLGSSPPTIPNLPASISGANTPAPSIPDNLSNNGQRKEDFESQQYENHGDNNPALYTDQQQMSIIGGFGSGFGGNTRSESDFTSSNSRGDNVLGNSGSINSGRNFGTKSSLSKSYLTSSNSRGDGFGGHGPINAQGFPNGYVSGYFDTHGSQVARTPSGGSSYALSNAQSKNQDAFAVSVGL